MQNINWMQIIIFITVCILSCLPLFESRGISLYNIYPHIFPKVSNHHGVDPGEPLFLTPYIESGQIDKARQLSWVGPLGELNLESYSGFFTVNKTYNSNMFFWFFPAQVGTGYSFTQADAGYTTNEADVGRDLYSCLYQFFTVFSEYQKNDFYVTGESYAGKYVPAISYYIHMKNPTAAMKINMKGMAIGDGLTDPETMMSEYASFMHSLGLLDKKQKIYFQSMTDQAIAYIRDKQFLSALQIFDSLFIGTRYPSYIFNATGTKNYYNLLLTEFCNLPDVRRSIHVGNLTFSDGEEVEKHLLNDVMDTVKPWVAVLMENYKVMFYNGQLDIIVAVPMTETFLLTIPWSGQDIYKEADRLIWKINPNDTEVAGYIRQARNFYQVIVQGAGHMVPYDQADRGWDMIQRFIENKSFCKAKVFQHHHLL